jgi:hypothetical protein
VLQEQGDENKERTKGKRRSDGKNRESPGPKPDKGHLSLPKFKLSVSQREKNNTGPSAQFLL